MDFDSSDDDALFDQRKPLKMREARPSVLQQEVISLASSTDDEYSDDEVATLRASPILDTFPRTTQSSALSQLTANSPFFATQPQSTARQTPRNKVSLSGRKRTSHAATEDSLLTHASTSPAVATGFLKLTKARDPVPKSSRASVMDEVATMGRKELKELNSKVLAESKQSSKKARRKSNDKATKESTAIGDDVASNDATKTVDTLPEAHTTKIRQSPKITTSKSTTRASDRSNVLEVVVPSNSFSSRSVGFEPSRVLITHSGTEAPLAPAPTPNAKATQPPEIAPTSLPLMAEPHAQQTVISAAKEQSMVGKEKNNASNVLAEASSRSIVNATGKENTKRSRSKDTSVKNAKQANKAKLAPPGDTNSDAAMLPTSVTHLQSDTDTLPTEQPIKISKGAHPTGSKSENVVTKACAPAPSLPGSRSNKAASAPQVAPATTKADAAPKKKKMSFQEQVLHHMLCAFKPFTLRSLADDLKTTEAALNYVMLSLVDKGLVYQKDFTSSKGRVKTLYWGNHDGKSKEVVVPTSISSDEREQVKREVIDLTARESSIKNMLAQVTKEPSNLEIDEKLKHEEAELNAQLARLDEVKKRIREASQSKPQVSQRLKMGGPPKSAALLAREQCPNRLKLRINHMRSEWKKRKEMCMDFVDKLADGMEKKPKEVMKLLDIDTDEMNAVVMPPKYTVS